MSYKAPVNNGIAVNELQWTKSATISDTNVKLAGEEAKDRLYEPKHKKKLVRVLTVIAYVFFVSLAAIMLSLYYVFLWNGDKKVLPKHTNILRRSEDNNNCDNIIAEMQQQIKTFDSDEMTVPVTSISDENENSTIPELDNLISGIEDLNGSTFIKKIMYYKKYDYGEND